MLSLLSTLLEGCLDTNPTPESKLMCDQMQQLKGALLAFQLYQPPPQSAKVSLHNHAWDGQAASKIESILPLGGHGTHTGASSANLHLPKVSLGVSKSLGADSTGLASGWPRLKVDQVFSLLQCSCKTFQGLRNRGCASSPCY